MVEKKEEGSWESEWEGRRQLTERKREGGWEGKKKMVEKERREGRNKEIFETSSLPATIIFPFPFSLFLILLNKIKWKQ